MTGWSSQASVCHKGDRPIGARRTEDPSRCCDESPPILPLAASDGRRPANGATGSPDKPPRSTKEVERIPLPQLSAMALTKARKSPSLPRTVWRLLPRLDHAVDQALGNRSQGARHSNNLPGRPRSVKTTRSDPVPVARGNGGGSTWAFDGIVDGNGVDGDAEGQRHLKEIFRVMFERGPTTIYNVNGWK